MNSSKEGRGKENVTLVLSKKDCVYLKDNVEAHIQDDEEALAETLDPVLSSLYQINIRYLKRILFTLEKSLEAEQ